MMNIATRSGPLASCLVLSAALLQGCGDPPQAGRAAALTGVATAAEVPIAAGGAAASLVVNPADARRVVIATVGGACGVLRSHDGGRRWSAPLPPPPGACGPALAYAPDGRRLYAAYNGATSVLLSHSDDDGRSWSGPVEVARLGSAPHACSQYRACRLTFHQVLTHPDGAEAAWVDVRYQFYSYVNIPGLPTSIWSSSEYLARSSDRGEVGSWMEPVLLLSHGGSAGRVSGSGSRATSIALAAGPGGELLQAWGEYAWFYSRPSSSERRQLLASSSSDHGRTWSATPVVLIEGQSPDVNAVIDSNGRAHLAIAQGGDLYHRQSDGAPHDTWSAPVRINGQPGAVAGAAQLVLWPGLPFDELHLAWLDQRGADGVRGFYAGRILGPGGGWSPDARVSDGEPASLLLAAGAQGAYEAWSLPAGGGIRGRSISGP